MRVPHFSATNVFSVQLEIPAPVSCIQVHSHLQGEVPQQASAGQFSFGGVQPERPPGTLLGTRPQAGTLICCGPIEIEGFGSIVSSCDNRCQAAPIVIQEAPGKC